MSEWSLANWLEWQETLSPSEIDLGLARVQAVRERLPLKPPQGQVITVGGTNGKGTTVHWLEQLLLGAGYRTGTYTSPHLIRYNERIRLAGAEVSDEVLVQAFQRVEQARQDTPLTYFEFGTLAAWVVLSQSDCDVWILEVGLGGRLDAVNALDPDISVITSVAMDHTEWLGDSLEAIAAEKAGILRGGRPAFYGEAQVPRAIQQKAGDLGLGLISPGRGFDWSLDGEGWRWQGAGRQLNQLPRPPGFGQAELGAPALALAVVEALDDSLPSRELVEFALQNPAPPGRFQRAEGRFHWILDVAHNEAAAHRLIGRLKATGLFPVDCAIVGMLADKACEGFCQALNSGVRHWITCDTQGPRGLDAQVLAERLAGASLSADIEAAGEITAAINMARRQTEEGGTILICGSFHVVGPALRWLGLY